MANSTDKSALSREPDVAGTFFGASDALDDHARVVWLRALEVLEDERSARAWICGRNRSLGGEAPFALLGTEAGYKLVLDTLGRIEHGIVS